MTISTPIRTDVLPFSQEQTQEYTERFDRDGYCLIPGVLCAEEITALKQAVDRVYEDDKYFDSHNRHYPNEFVAARLFEIDPVFEEMLTREPIISLMEHLLGSECHLIAQNVIRNNPGESLSTFHIDGDVFFPAPPGHARHSAEYRLSHFIVAVQIPLTDVEAMEYGPTEYVPGSHYSGRKPKNVPDLEFEGQKAVPVFCKAGDIYLHNGQCWHRGAPNTSDRTRYLLQQAYAQRFVSQRFYPFLNYQMPQHVLQNADERRRRVLGVHPHGYFG